MNRYLIRLIFIIVISVSTGRSLSSQDLFNIPLKSLEGNTTTLADISNFNIIVLDFWSTWCKPCIKSIPKLIELSDKYNNERLQFVGINEDSPRNISKVKPFANSMNINYPVLIDNEQELMSELMVNSFPTLIILNRKGEVLYFHEGYIPGDETEIEEELIKAIKTHEQ